MAELILVRHGQANAAARSEDEYDRLSEIGRLQGRWLGEWLSETGADFDRVLSGTLVRHRHTADEMRVTPEADARWNELAYHDLAAAFAEESGVAAPFGSADFSDFFASMMAAWAAGGLKGAPETYASFRDRVRGAVDDAQAAGGRTLVVTSGGVIGQMVARVMDLDVEKTAHLTLGVGNTTMQRLIWTGRRWSLLEFGAAPHLAPAERAHARTFV